MQKSANVPDASQVSHSNKRSVIVMNSEHIARVHFFQVLQNTARVQKEEHSMLWSVCLKEILAVTNLVIQIITNNLCWINIFQIRSFCDHPLNLHLDSLPADWYR